MQTLSSMLEDDPWLRKKVDRNRRMMELRKYVDEFLPELRHRPLCGFLDIGPGPGELIELAMAEGMDAYGWDAETPEGGMGDAYLQYSKLSHKERGLDVTYCNDYRGIQARFNGSLSIINLRGSIEQALGDLMIGEPHDKHHDCRKLAWDTAKGRDGLMSFLKCMRASLTGNGILMIAANGASNTDWYDKEFPDIYLECGFTRVERFGDRTHKLYA